MAATEGPVYDHPPEKVQDGRMRRILRLPLAENLFFGAAMVFSFMFAVIMLRKGINQPVNITYFLGVWLILAYLALPRLHRVLTALYVPEYFIGRARTSDGLLGDPINVALTGQESQIHHVMRQADWNRADPVNVTSSIRMVAAALARRSYPRAPVSPLLLFGRTQDFAYQQAVAGTPNQRHHVRFWRCPPGWLLPGGRQVDWLAAGTYDRRVGLSLFTFQVTHKIDRNIDVERDYIVASALHADVGVRLQVIEDFSTGYHSRSGGGDTITTDGDLPILDVSRVTTRQEGTEPDEEDLLHVVGRRPLSVLAATMLALLSLGVSLSLTFRDTVGDLRDPATVVQAAQADSVVALAVTLAFSYGALGMLAWFTFLGHQWARLCMLAVLSFTQLSQFVTWMGHERPPLATLVVMSIDILMIYALTTQSARQWTAPSGAATSRRPEVVAADG